jgi:hypothetical protein
VQAVWRIRAQQPRTWRVGDRSVSYEFEDPKCGGRPEQTQKRLDLYAQRGRQIGRGHTVIRRHAISNLKIGENAKYARNLESSHQKIECGMLMIRVERFSHGIDLLVEGAERLD